MNEELIKKYPFLAIRGIDGEIINTKYTWLDDVEHGWRDLFLQMCEEIKEPLIKSNYINEFQFLQIKEKYGRLTMYHNGCPDEIDDIIGKYEKMSETTCVKCGKPATLVSTGWICPYCKECAEKSGKNSEHFNDIKAWYEEWYKVDEN